MIKIFKLKNDKGNALLLVLFVMMCCTAIITTTIYLSSNQLIFSQAQRKYSNIQYLAISGAEKAVSDFNNILNSNIDTIINNTTESILNQNNYSEFLEFKTNKFIIKDDILNENLEKQINSFIRSKNYEFQYYATIEDFKYRTDVQIIYVSKNKYKVDSRTTNIATRNIYQVVGEINLSNDIDIENTFLEQYILKAIPNILTKAIINKGNIILRNNAQLNIKGDILVNGDVEISDNSKLNIDGSAYINSNLFTNVYNLADSSQIYINNDVIANNISILNSRNDAYKIDSMAKNHIIDIKGNVYTKKNLNISRYTLNSKINLDKNLFSIDGCIFNQSEQNSLINIQGAALVNGVAFINFDNEFKPLLESIGQPYDNVYEKYINNDLNNEWFSNLIEQNIINNSNININDIINSIAKGYISANNKTWLKQSSNYSVVSDLNKLNSFFNIGSNETELLQIQNTNWNKNDLDLISKSGIKGFIDSKFEIFSTSLFNQTKFQKNANIDIYNPVIIIDNTNPDEVEIDINQLYNKNKSISVIIDTRENGIIKLKSSGYNKFKGIICSNGIIKIVDNMSIEGIILVDNKYTKNKSGLIINNVKADIIYNNDIINLYTDDYNLRRQIYSYLNIATYNLKTYFSEYLKIDKNSTININIKDLYKLSFKLNKLKYIE